MKKAFILFISIYNVLPVFSQGIFNQIQKEVNKENIIKGVDSISKTITGKTSSSLTNDEIIAGLKEALSIGTNISSKKLGTIDGYFKDPIIKIMMPNEVNQVTNTLRKFGMGSLVDKAELSMNRAAEDAAAGVGDFFIQSIQKITITDGLAILNGGDAAATNYLKETTSAELTQKMKPVIEASLKKVDATKYWSDIFSNYNKFLHQNVNTDLAAYVTEKAMSGLFYNIAQEEQKIRKDPAAQVTDNLKKVFGNK